MRVLYHALADDGRRCTRCSNRVQLFGCVDLESRWRGYCAECNARWYGWKLNSCLGACSLQFSVFLLRAFGLNEQMALCIRRCLNCCAPTVRHSVLLQHELKLIHLLWLGGGGRDQMYWLAGSDSEEEEEEDEGPSLRTLKNVHVASDAFVRYCFRGCHGRVSQNPTLLDAVSVYLIDCDVSSFDFPEFSGHRQTSFDLMSLERTLQKRWLRRRSERYGARMVHFGRLIAHVHRRRQVLLSGCDQLAVNFGC
jgi:hypothetical protein